MTLRDNASIDVTKPLSVLGRVAYIGALAVILTAAIPQGTIEPWQKGAFVVAISILGILRVADGLVNTGFRIAEPRLLLPVIGIIGLAAIQLVPISADAQMSLDTYQTQSFILVFAGLIVCAELLFNYARTNIRLQQLILVVLIIAIGSSLFGLVRPLLEGNGLLLPTEKGYAQFVNRNHFALLAEMGLGLLAGILLKAELRNHWRLLGWIACGLLVYSMIGASSRGGLVSLTGMAILAVFVHVMTSSRSGKGVERSARFRLATKILTAASLCILTFGIIVVLIAFIGGDAVVTRIENIDSEIGTAEQSRVNRGAIWESTWQMIRDRPVFGSGFGAYGTAITKYDTTNGHFLLEQAHNDYLEIVANGGVIGAILFIAFAFLVGARMLINLRTADGFRRACCFGSVVGIFGVLIHSFVDFGLHVLVNALVFVVLIVIGTARIEHSVQRKRRERSVQR